MNFFKNLFSGNKNTKTEELKSENDEDFSEFSNYLLISLNDKIQPLDRGEYYEDHLDDFLEENNLGEVVGGGTMMQENGEIQFVDVEVELFEGKDFKKSAEIVIKFLEEKNVPKNSVLTIEQTGEKINFGNSEGLAIYLDGVNLDEKVYKNCDSNFVVSEIKRLIGDDSEIVRFWQGNTQTGIYFYGKSFEEMKKQISEFVAEYPLCKNAEIKQIA